MSKAKVAVKPVAKKKAPASKKGANTKPKILPKILTIKPSLKAAVARLNRLKTVQKGLAASAQYQAHNTMWDLISEQDHIIQAIKKGTPHVATNYDDDLECVD